MSKETLMDESLFQGGPYTGTHPIRSFYSHNLDFSTFPLLCERVYAELDIQDAWIRQEMPYAVFQHVMTGILNAELINHIKVVNAEERYTCDKIDIKSMLCSQYIPVPIIEYIKSVTNTITPQGNLVKVNIPQCAIPQEYVPAEGNNPEQPSGGFGVCTAANHNSYECYVSPLVTSRLVRATIIQNETREFGPWQPLPDEMAPANGVPNANLLGYRPNVERLNPGVLSALQHVVFPNGNDMHSRLKWSPILAARVSKALKRLENCCKMHLGMSIDGSNIDTSIVGWIRVEMIEGSVAHQNRERISSLMGTVCSSVAMGSSQCYKVETFALKRERTAQARGFCYTTANGSALPGWLETINDNFNMVGEYGPVIGQDLHGLRDAMHVRASPNGDRVSFLAAWLRRNFFI